MADTPNVPTTPSETEETDTDYRQETESEIDDINALAYMEAVAGLSTTSLENDEDDDEEEEVEFEEEDEETEHAHYIEVEIEEEGAQNATESETERSELYRIPYLLLAPLIDIILLIFGIVVARQRRQVMRILANSELGRLFFHANPQDDFDDEEDEDFNPVWRRRRRRPKPDPNRFPKVPSDEGTRLMESGTFGTSDIQDSSEDIRTSPGSKKRLTTRILERELATESYTRQKMNQRLMAQDMIPSSNADMIIHYNQPVYSGQFSDDGNFFFSVNKDYRVRMYDTSNPYKWRYYKTVEYIGGQWTLTDASLSPDNKFLAYTSIRSTVCLATTDPNDKGDPYNLDLSDRAGRGNNNFPYRSRAGSFGIWSIRFSGDGRQLVAGATAGSIVVYDIESRRTLHRIFGHDGDVNAVCFADSSSPHILYSGSDDTTLKVWDTRSMGDSRAAGAFIGHTEGLTYIDSKMDGRYILSNGKDQSMKLWDLRMVMSDSDFNALPPSTQESRFDYRWGPYDEDSWYVHPNDNSLVTYRGHQVLRTLIRCHFSPPGSTNSRYVYSGSADGKVYIWNMDGTIAGKVDVYAATVNSRRMPREFGIDDWEDDELTQNSWRTCVRDASWHPNAPIIAASALNGYGSSTGTCTVHSWNDGAEEDEGEPKMGLRVNQKLEMDPLYYITS